MVRRGWEREERDPAQDGDDTGGFSDVRSYVIDGDGVHWEGRESEV